MSDKIRPIVTLIILLILGMLWLSWFHDPAVRAGQRLKDSTTVVNAHSHQTDVRVSRMAAESSLLVGQLRRFARNDSVARGEIARLKARAPYVRADISDSTPRDSLVAIIRAHEADALRRDTLESEQEAVIDSQGAALSIWTALAVERGELLTRALSERDAFRKIAHAWEGKAGKRFGCAGGPAVVASLDGHVSAGVGFACGWRF